MKPSDRGFCLVLSGGGAKGVYHLGVWRALGELGIEVDALVGTSIGALFAAFLAQGAETGLESVVRSVALDSLFKIPPELMENGELRLDRASFPAVRTFAANLIEKRGLDTSPLRQLLADHLDETALRRSGRDLGFVTVNLSNLTPREVFLDDIPDGQLVDYLMASAAFPGFEQPVIDGKRYIDGGLHDNIPFAMARSRGYRRIIVSDISGAGRNRKTEIEGGLTAYIRSSIKMGGVLELDPGFLGDFERLGYLDTLRTFGHLGGHSYFVEPDPCAEEAYLREVGPPPSYPPRMAHDPRRLLKDLECAASLLEVPRIRIYRYDTLARAIAGRRAEEEAKLAALLGDPRTGRRSLAALVRSDVAAGVLGGSPYHTWRLVEALFPGRTGNVLRRTLVGLTPELPAGIAYLKSVKP